MTSQILGKEEEKILQLEVRRKVYEIVKKNAGCHFREIERRSGLSTGSVQYHLTFLAKHDLIKEEKGNNAVRYFPLDIAAQNRKMLSLLRQKSIRHILVFILLHNTCHHEQIVEAVNLSPSTVSWHVKKLEREGIIASKREGRKTEYTILSNKEEITKLLITYQQSFFDSLIDNVIEMWETE